MAWIAFARPKYLAEILYRVTDILSRPSTSQSLLVILGPPSLLSTGSLRSYPLRVKVTDA